jgi:hypothetical protein
MAGFNDFSTTPASNASVGAMNWSENQLPSTVNNSARQLVADLRYELGAVSSTVSAGATVDLGAIQEGSIVLSGNATISNFGSTGTTGLRKRLRFTGTPTIAHSVGAITCPGSANIVAAAGDTAEAECQGSGAWRITDFMRFSGRSLVDASAGQIVGTSTNDNAAAGNVGEFISSTVTAGAAVSLTTGTPANVTSISLTAGDWDVFGNVSFTVNGATTMNAVVGWISTTSAALPTFPNDGSLFLLNVTIVTGNGPTIPVGAKRISVAGTTTVYLSAQLNFAVSTAAAYGFIGARRAR